MRAAHLVVAGGSSGGESALIAAGGSVLGVGSDIGGSLRIPAHMAGIVALKPTDRRVSSVGCRPSVAGQEVCRALGGVRASLCTCALRCARAQAVPGTVGPMAPAGHVDSLGLFMEAVCVEEAWRMDAHLVPIPWNAQVFASAPPLCARRAPTARARVCVRQECGRTDRLKVAVFDGVPGLLPVSPACQRAVQEAAAAVTRARRVLRDRAGRLCGAQLRAAGHEVVSWTPPGLEEAAWLYLALLTSDGGKTVMAVRAHPLARARARHQTRAPAAAPRGRRARGLRHAPIHQRGAPAGREVVRGGWGGAVLCAVSVHFGRDANGWSRRGIVGSLD